MDDSTNDNLQKPLSKREAKEQKKTCKQKKKDDKELAQLRRFAYGDDRVHKYPKSRKAGGFLWKMLCGFGGDGDGRVVAYHA